MKNEFKIGENILEYVQDLKYLGTEAENTGVLNKEIAKRIQCMKFNYSKFKDDTFDSKYLSLKKKLEMFVCVVIPAGMYNCSCWNLRLFDVAYAFDDPKTEVEIICTYY